ncbi:ABC transporter substrate-binding protein [Candidatus Poribacteria bacterium]|nr:ABC transporter substrate-binding protein [Candidatus Poribacteria bacterium]
MNSHSQLYRIGSLLPPGLFKWARIGTMFVLILMLSGILLSCNQAQQIVDSGPYVLKVGLIYTAPSQISTLYGAQLAVTQINLEGGILGLPLELVARNDQDNTEFSEELAEELITKDGVVALAGPNYSRHAVNVGPVAQRSEVPLVTTTATNPSVTEAGDYVFMAAFTDDFQGKVMARFARDTLRAPTAALMTQAGDVYSEGLSNIFAENFSDLGGTIVAREVYHAGDTDFTSQLTAIAAQAPSVIFMPGFVPEVPLAIRQARTIPQPNASGITATFLGGDGWDEPDLLSGDSQALDGSYFSNLFSPETQDPDAQAFVRAYRSMFGIAPTGSAAMGYDALKLIATAMRRAGSFDKTALRAQLAATQEYKGATTLLSYDADRHPTKSAVILKIQNGRVNFHRQVEP